MWLQIFRSKVAKLLISDVFLKTFYANYTNRGVWKMLPVTSTTMPPISTRLWDDATSYFVKCIAWTKQDMHLPCLLQLIFILYRWISRRVLHHTQFLTGFCDLIEHCTFISSTLLSDLTALMKSVLKNGHGARSWFWTPGVQELWTGAR